MLPVSEKELEDKLVEQLAEIEPDKYNDLLSKVNEKRRFLARSKVGDLPKRVIRPLLTKAKKIKHQEFKAPFSITGELTYSVNPEYPEDGHLSYEVYNDDVSLEVTSKSKKNSASAYIEGLLSELILDADPYDVMNAVSAFKGADKLLNTVNELQNSLNDLANLYNIEFEEAEQYIIDLLLKEREEEKAAKKQPAKKVTKKATATTKKVVSRKKPAVSKEMKKGANKRVAKKNNGATAPKVTVKKTRARKKKTIK